MDKEKNVQNLVEDAKDIGTFITEQTKGLLDDIVKRNIKSYMNESIINEVEDDETAEDDETTEGAETTEDGETTEGAETTEDGETDLDVTSDIETSDDVADVDSTDDIETELSIDSVDDGESEVDSWAEFDSYKIDDENYDFTNLEDTDMLTKVYKLLNDDDQVVVVKNDDSLEIQDKELGSGYIIKTDGGVDEVPAHTDVVENISDVVGLDDDVEAELDLNSLGELGDLTVSDTVDTTLEVEDDVVDEVTSLSSKHARNTSKTHTSTTREPHLPLGSQNISAGGEYKAHINEAIVNKALRIKENSDAMKLENEKLVKDIVSIKSVLEEARVSNSNLYHILKLFIENATTKKEKISIVNRFGNSVKTLKEGKTLYKTITNELVENSKVNTIKQPINETYKVNNKADEVAVSESAEISKIRNLMERINRK